jgi:hypothetical protein
MKIVLGAIFALVMLSCNRNHKEVRIVKHVEVTTDRKNNVNSTHELRAEISGMMCEMGCGGSIRKALRATGGVSRVYYEFIDGRKAQIINVQFDNKLITAKALLSKINSLNNKQFSCTQKEVVAL